MTKNTKKQTSATGQQQYHYIHLVFQSSYFYPEEFQVRSGSDVLLRKVVELSKKQKKIAKDPGQDGGFKVLN